MELGHFRGIVLGYCLIVNQPGGIRFQQIVLHQDLRVAGGERDDEKIDEKSINPVRLESVPTRQFKSNCAPLIDAN